MNILGISAFYHDSAACLVQDGTIVAAAQEERFTRKKHDFSFPRNAIRYCLEESRLRGNDLDYVAFYDKPFIKFERILETYLAYAPIGVRSFMKAIPLWIRQKLWIKEIVRDELQYRGTIIFPEHHQSHAASAFFPSPFQRAAFLTIDGVGEWTTASFGVGNNNEVHILAKIHFPHSLGLLYSAFTSLAFLFVGVFLPVLLKPLHKLWMMIALLMGWLVTGMIMILLFYLVVTPIGLFLRLRGKDLLHREFNRTADTYWIQRERIARDKKDLERQF